MQNDAVAAPLQREVRRFEMSHRFFKGPVKCFSEFEAPTWLTSENTIPGSTMDNRWFWQDHVLTLKVGESINTDFQVIARVS